MSNLEFFKKQAKNFLKDWQTQTITTNTDGSKSYHYDWKFYDVDYHFNKLKLDDKDRLDIKLARSQHWLAQILGQKNWNVLISLTDFELDKAEDLLRSIKNQKDETKGTPKVQIIPCFRVRCQFEMTLNDKAQFKIAFPKIKAKIVPIPQLRRYIGLDIIVANSFFNKATKSRGHFFQCPRLLACVWLTCARHK